MYYAPTYRRLYDRAVVHGAVEHAPHHAEQSSQVKHALGRESAQPKLTIGAPNDRFEQEADRVADEIVRMPDGNAAALDSAGTSAESTVQRVCAGCEEEEEETPDIQRQAEEEEEEEEEVIQAKRADYQGPALMPEVADQIHDIRDGGRPLSAGERDYFEPRFGRDFSDVKIHTDGQAAEVSEAIHARAFTVGRDVVFGAGEYAPGTTTGRRLLAHELTHVVQQTGDHTQRRSGADVTQASGESVQRQVKNVKQTELAHFFSVYENALPKDLALKYLTNPTLMAIQRRVIVALVRHVQRKKAPLTVDQFAALVDPMTRDYGTTLLVCHNVTKALARGKSPIDWKNVSRNPLVYSLAGTTYRFNPKNFHKDAVEVGSLGISVFYAMFSPFQFGVADEGDWYHYFVTAAASYYAASSQLTHDVPKPGTDFTGEAVAHVASLLQDKSLKDSAAYRGWRFANALSFLEGGVFGTKPQKEVNQESGVHLQGASAGLAALGRIPGDTWKWCIPKTGSLLNVVAGGGVSSIALNQKTVHKILSGIEGQFRITVVDGKTPDKWYDTPDTYVEYETGLLGRLLGGGGKTKVKKDTTSPVWNEYLVSLDYDALRSVTLKLIDEDDIADDPIVDFKVDLRPGGRRTKTFSFSAPGSTLRVKIDAEGNVVLKGI